MGMLGVYMLADEATIERLSNEDDLFEAIEEYEEEETTISWDIDKLWDGLHFLLTGISATEDIEGEPLSEAVIGTELLDDEDIITYTEPNHIVDVVEALNKVEIDALLAKMDVSSFEKADIYPDIWVKENEELLKTDLKNAFLGLKAFYEQALKAQTGVLVSIY